jgi:hypothetical protein
MLYLTEARIHLDYRLGKFLESAESLLQGLLIVVFSLDG